MLLNQTLPEASSVNRLVIHSKTKGGVCLDSPPPREPSGVTSTRYSIKSRYCINGWYEWQARCVQTSLRALQRSEQNAGNGEPFYPAA
jgi:hypothetical protein